MKIGFLYPGQGLQEKGMGLGLWIANTFVKLHDGSIIVESKPGKGSVFTVIIPQN